MESSVYGVRSSSTGHTRIQITSTPQHLSGEALKIVEPLGHSAAIALLERKFGGERRKLALHLEELENIKSLRPGNAGDIERFADLLDVTVVNLKEANRHDELGRGTLYISLCKKLNENAFQTKMGFSKTSIFR